MNIWIAQLLCPVRHCIAAFPFEEGSVDVSKNKAEIGKLFESGQLRRRCGICGSTELKWHYGKTVFENMGAAKMGMALIQVEQVLTRAHLDDLGQTYDVQEKN